MRGIIKCCRCRSDRNDWQTTEQIQQTEQQTVCDFPNIESSVLSCSVFTAFPPEKISYKIKKESCLQDSPPAAGRICDTIPFRRSAILPEGLLLYRNFLYSKKECSFKHSSTMTD